MLKKKLFFRGGILLLLLTGVAWGFYKYNKPHQSAGEERPALSVQASVLFRQYKADEQKADQLYLNKVIDVEGTLSQVISNGGTEIWILAGDEQGGINCELFKGEKGDGPQVKPGDRVKIRGRCTGYLMDVNLADCVRR